MLMLAFNMMLMLLAFNMLLMLLVFNMLLILAMNMMLKIINIVRMINKEEETLNIFLMSKIKLFMDSSNFNSVIFSQAEKLVIFFCFFYQRIEIFYICFLQY